MPKRIDVVGRTFGRALVLGDGEPWNGRRRVNCRCSCGTEFICDPRQLFRGTKSCGCLQREAVADSARSMTQHGMTGSPEYNTWIKIKGRCYNPADRKYPDYGGRGIRVCARWLEAFENFLDDMGRKPSPELSIDRISVDGDYEPGNCRWATPKTQSRNKRRHRFVMLGEETVPLSEACERAGVNYRSALWRLNAGLGWMPLPPAPAQPQETHDLGAANTLQGAQGAPAGSAPADTGRGE